MTGPNVTRRWCLNVMSATSVITAVGPWRIASARLFGGGGGGIGGALGVLKELLTNAQRQLGSLQQILRGADLTGAGNVIAELQKIRDLFGQIQAIGYQIQTVATQFDALFPEDFADLEPAEVLGFTARWITNARNTLRHAMQIHAEVVESQLWTETQTQLLLATSKTGGPNVTLQSMAELQAVQVQQLSRLQGLIAAQARMFATRLAEEEAIKQRAAALRAGAERDSFISRDPPPIRLGSDL